MKSKKVRMEISYPHASDWIEAQEVITKIAKKHGGKPNGDAGAGFGRRDVGYDFPNKEKALAFAKDADKVIIEFEYFFPDEN